MEVRDKVVVVTGAAQGIGRALARRFAAAGARKVVVADLDQAACDAVAREIGGIGLRCDVSRESDIQALVRSVEAQCGGIDVFFSNAGILGPRGGYEVADEVWQRMWAIHCMAHVWAARAVVPGMLERGGGYFLSTASAAGVLTILESAPYAVTKHGAVAFAEWLSVTHGGRGLRVSCLCPQAVATAMVSGDGGSAGGDGVLSPEAVADAVLQAMADERFFVFPHPQVEQYMAVKGSNHPRWLAGMRKAYARLTGAAPAAKP